MTTLFEIFGALLIVAGVGMIYRPAAVILLGICLVVASVALDTPKKSSES